MTDLVALGALVLQGGLVLAVLEGYRRRNVPAVVNGLVALAAALLPAALRHALRLGFDQALAYGPELPLWIAAAGVIHATGMLGLYDKVWWWDHLAHAVSAALVTALVYASAVVAAPEAPLLGRVPAGAVGATVAVVLLLAVFWELVELFARQVGERYGVGPVLVVYGRRDTALDLVFNALGAAAVLLLDLRVFVPVLAPFPRATAMGLLAVGVLALVGSVLLALGVGWGRRRWP